MNEESFAKDYKDRLVEFARKVYNKGQTNFEWYVGLSSGSISSAKKSGMSAMSVAKIAERCPELSLRWLLLGEGEIWSAGEAPGARAATSPPSAT